MVLFISKRRIQNIKKSILYKNRTDFHMKNDVLKSNNKIDFFRSRIRFLISRIRFCIEKSISSSVIFMSRIRFFDIKNSIFCIEKKIDFLISKNQILDITRGATVTGCAPVVSFCCTGLY